MADVDALRATRHNSRIDNHDPRRSKGRQCLPGVCHCNSLKTRGRAEQRVSRMCGAKPALQLNFYSTMLPSRNRRNSMKTQGCGPSYPSIKRGSQAPLCLDLRAGRQSGFGDGLLY
jgi:hypothetical protein